MQKIIPLIFTISSFVFAGDLKSDVTNALKFNNIYTANIAENKVYQTQVEIARDALKPTIKARGALNRENYESNSGEDTFTGNYKQIDINQTLYNKQAYESYKQSDIAAEKSNNDLLQAQQNLIAETINQYLDVLNAHAIYVAAKSQTKSLKLQNDNTTTKYKLGAVTEAQALEAKSYYDAAVAHEIAMKNNFIDSIDIYSSTTKVIIPSFSDLKSSAPLNTTNPIDINQQISNLEKNNLILKSIKLSTNIAKKSIDIAKSGYYPTINLNGSYNDSHNPNNVLNSFLNNEDTKIKRLELSINLPLYEGGITHDKIKKEEYAYEKILSDYQTKKSDLILALRINQHHIQNAKSQMIALYSSILSGKRSLESQQEYYKSGLSTNLEILNAIENLQKARSKYAETRYNYLKDKVTEKQLLGTLNMEDVEKLTRLLTQTIELPEESF
jgi:outer membrane protein